MSEDLIRAARNAVRLEEWGAVWKYANAALTAQPDRPEAMYLCGCALRQAGNIGLAALVFRRALAIDASQANLWMHYGACLHDLHRWDEAREAFLTVHKRMPTDAMPMANIASGYVQEGDCKPAVEWAERALKVDPHNHIANIAAGFAKLGLGRWEDGWKHAEYLYGSPQQIRIYNDPANEEPIWDSYEAVAHTFPNKKMEPFILTLPLKPKKKTIHQHEGEELLFVLEGTMKFLLGSQEYLLEEGDCIYFDSGIRHFGESGGRKEAKCFMVIYTAPAEERRLSPKYIK